MRLIETILTLCFICIMSFSSAQTWKTIGKEGFSKGGAYEQSLTFSPSSNTPYVAYQVGKNSLKGHVIVKKFNGNQWITVGNDSFSDGKVRAPKLTFPSLSNTPYIVFKDLANGGDITVMKFEGNQWVTVGKKAFAGGEIGTPSIDFPASGNIPYVAYKDFTNGYGITVKKFDGDQWVTVGNESFTGIAQSVSIAFSSSNTPYVVYLDQDNGFGTTVKKFNGSQWVTVGSENLSNERSAYQDLVFSSSDNPFVVYNEGGDKGNITVKKFSDSGWKTLGKKNFNKLTTNLNIAIPDSSNMPYVAFGYDETTNKRGFTVKKFNGQQWVKVGSMIANEGGMVSCLAFPSSSETPYVAYMDVTNGSGTTVKKFIKK